MSQSVIAICIAWNIHLRSGGMDDNSRGRRTECVYLDTGYEIPI